jgi:ligand-binding sensor domain-containing protein
MSIFRRWVVVMVMGVGLLAGCRAAGGGGGMPAAAAAAAGPPPSVRFNVMLRAESVPIVALAFRSPHLWVGTEHGLRRWNVVTDESEWVGSAAGLLGRSVSALGTDMDGVAWVATEAGVGNLRQIGQQLRYQPVGALAGITLLSPTRDKGVWAAGPAGLFSVEGRGW